jgi:hypothetical protein
MTDFSKYTFDNGGQKYDEKEHAYHHRQFSGHLQFINFHATITAKKLKCYARQMYNGINFYQKLVRQYS